MNITNLKLVILNVQCCTATKAVQLADLYTKGNKCAEGELIKLKTTIDKLNLLKEYYCSVTIGENTTILTEDNVDILARDIMHYCNICDCQLISE